MKTSRRFGNSAVFVLPALILTLTPAALGQDQKANYKTAPTTNLGSVKPTPLDKCYALDDALGKNALNWREIFNKTEKNIDPNIYSDTKVSVPVLLGFRICDGILAIKARDEEKLNSCADDIENLGKKMGVKDDQLRRAKLVKAYAGKKEWARVYLELGYLQQDIEHVIEENFEGKGARPNVRKILYAAGWLQGACYTSQIVNDNYNATTSGILREPTLVKELRADLESTGLSSDPIVSKMIEALYKLEKLVNVPMDGSLTKENVKLMSEVTSLTASECVKLAK